LRGSEAILPDRFSSQSTEKTINLVWARKALNISSIQFLSLKESEAIFPDPIEGSQALQIRSQIVPDHRQALWSSESRSPRGIAAGTALERRPPEDLPESGRPICIAALRPQKKKTDLRPARALGRRRSAPRRSRPARVLRSWRAGPSELLTRPRLGAVPRASWFARPALVARVLARPQTISVVRRRLFSQFLFILSVLLAGLDCNFDRYYSIPIAASKSSGTIVLY
jgi:hypothetical protein